MGEKKTSEEEENKIPNTMIHIKLGTRKARVHDDDDGDGIAANNSYTRNADTTSMAIKDLRTAR